MAQSIQLTAPNETSYLQPIGEQSFSLRLKSVVNFLKDCSSTMNLFTLSPARLSQPSTLTMNL